VEAETLRFVREMFRRYYTERMGEITPPSRMELREFGFLEFGEKMMIRHKGFRTPEELRTFIAQHVPAHVYYSSAYYRDPEADMELKGWLGADLVFDIDADHIPTPCKERHDRWACRECGTAGRGMAPDKCPSCGGVVESEVWFCDKCLEAAKEETIKLLDILVQDFGLSYGELSVCFSGHRGYHVHVEDETLKELGREERREIVDYVRGQGIEADLHGVLEKPDLTSPGWRGRLARGMYEVLLRYGEEDFKRMGLKPRVVKALTSKRDAILRRIEEGLQLDSVPGVGEASWKVIAMEAARECGALVDTVVTADVHRLIRMPSTLHGKTGFRTVEAPVRGLEGFDPLREAVAFKGGSVKVFVERALRFRVGDVFYGPFEKEVVELPIQPALLLLCKGVARLVEVGEV